MPTIEAAKKNFDRSKLHLADGMDDDCDGVKSKKKCKKALKKLKKKKKNQKAKHRIIILPVPILLH